VKVVRDTAADAPLYARVLRLHYIRPGSLLCFGLFEGVTIVAGLLALAELTSWWAVIVLPATVAGMVKINDVVAGAFASAFTPSLALAGAGRGGQPGRRGSAGNVGSRGLGGTRPLSNAGIGSLTAGVRGLPDRARSWRGRAAVGRWGSTTPPQRHTVQREEAPQPDRTEALRPGTWSSDETEPLVAGRLGGRAPADDGLPVADASPGDGGLSGDVRLTAAADDDPTTPLVRRGRHAADASDDPPITGRHGLDGGELSGRVYGTSRTPDHDETPAVGWWRRTPDGDPERPDDDDGSPRPDAAQRDRAAPPPQGRGGGAVNGRPQRSVHDDDNVARYRGGLNQGRFN
jgi:hypothetical protein